MAWFRDGRRAQDTRPKFRMITLDGAMVHGNIGSSRPRMKDNKVVNIAAVPHRSPFRYPGGKTWLVPRIRAWLQSLPTKPREFAEPFAGGAIVGLSVVFEDLAERLVLVEMDEDVGAVWHVLLTGDAERLGARIVDFDVTLGSVKAVLANPTTTALDRRHRH